MTVEISMPSLGMTMEEGAVVAWHVKEGDRVDAQQVILEIEAEKTAMEILAPEAGVVGPLLVEPGETVAVGTVLVELRDD